MVEVNNIIGTRRPFKTLSDSNPKRIVPGIAAYSKIVNAELVATEEKPLEVES